jgi:quinol monooxygenase YgiN
MVRVGLLVRLQAKPGREMDVENLLREALQLVDAEEDTLVWFAVRLAPDTFAIFDAFPDDEGRQAHLSGQVASALMEKGPELLAAQPTVEHADIIAGKLPGIPVGVSVEATDGNGADR